MKRIAAIMFSLVLIAGCTGQTPDVPKNFTAYDSQLYSVDRPASWEVEEHDSFIYFKTPLESDSNNLQENIVVYVAPLEDPNQDLIHFFQDSVEALMATTPGFTVVEHREDKLGDVPAYRIVYTEGEEEPRIKYLQVFAVKGGNSYIVTYTAPVETYDNYLADAEAIISSYEVK